MQEIKKHKHMKITFSNAVKISAKIIKFLTLLNHIILNNIFKNQKQVLGVFSLLSGIINKPKSYTLRNLT